MRKALVFVLVIGLSPIVRLAAEEETGNWEKVTDVSPDKKFGVRITCSSEPDDPKNIDPALITAAELVSLPSKKRVLEFSQDYYHGGPPKIYWAQDSNWLALSVSEGPRVTDTEVYHRTGEEFEKLETEGMTVDPGGDVRNQYIEPVKWLKPGTLVVTQLTIFRDEKGESTIQFTVQFKQDGKFFISNKKKVPNKKE